jgi:hypothetical protein
MLADRQDPGTEPRLLVAVTHEITDGHDPARTITKKFGFAEIDEQEVRSAGEARYLDYEPLDDAERPVASPLRDAPWLASGVEAGSRSTGPLPRACPRNWPAPATWSPPVSRVAAWSSSG